MARRDIFHVYQQLEHQKAWFRQSYPAGEIDELRLELLELCRRLDAEIRKARRRDGWTSRYDALCALLGRAARKELDQLSFAARRAGFSLKKPQGLTAQVHDLRSERRHVLREALRIMRRVKQDGRMRAEAWGLSASRTSPRFRRFLAFLLECEESEISQDEVKKVLKELEREGSAECQSEEGQ